MGVIRILHLRDAESFGGPEKTIQESVRLGDGEEFSYEVAFFVSPANSPALDRFRRSCELTELDPGRLAFPAEVARVRDLVRNRRIDILHSHDLKTRVLASRTRMGIHVSTAHGHIQTGWKSRVRNAIDRRMFRSVDRLLVVSDAMSRDLSRWGVASTVVRNSIALDQYPYGHSSRALRKQLGWTSDEWVLGCVGRLSPEKGQAELIRAYATLRQSWPNLRLIFSGDGPDRHKLESECHRAGFADLIRFVGHRSDMLEVYGGLDALVLNSRSEGLPNVVLEALALGVPVVATAVGGTPELIRDGVDGLLYEEGNQTALLGALEAVLTDAESARDRARSGRSRVEAEFPVQDLVAATHAIYREEYMLATEGRHDGLVVGA